MQNQVKILSVIFDTEIKKYEIPAFRGAIIAKVGRDNILFHNHNGKKEFVYKYPLIQYKTIHRKPAIVCLTDGVDEIHKFFENSDWNLLISGRELNMKIYKLNMNQFNIQVWDKMFKYRLHNWIALNRENYETYKHLDGATERIEFLEKKLIGNILSFAKGIGITVEKEIKLKITQIDAPQTVKLKGEKLLGFNPEFKTNFFLPANIGLGKSVSIGYGMIGLLNE